MKKTSKANQKLCFDDPRAYLIHLSLGLPVKSAVKFYNELKKKWPAGKTRNLPDIVKETGWHFESCHRLLRVLVYLGLLQKQDDDIWYMPEK